MAANWFVIQTKPNAELQACRRLDDQGFTTYCPMETVRRSVLGEMRERHVPLFRGYVFTEMDTEGDDRWKAAASTRGVMTILPQSDAPKPIREVDVTELYLAEREGYFKRGMVRPGEHVRVFRGTLANQVLECIHADGDRIKALWSCMGAPRVVDVRLSDVTVA